MKTLKKKKTKLLTPNLSIPNPNFYNSILIFFSSQKCAQIPTYPQSPLSNSLFTTLRIEFLRHPEFFSQKFKFPIYNALISWSTLYTPFSSSAIPHRMKAYKLVQVFPWVPPSSPPSSFASCSGREDTRNQQQNLTGLKFRLERKWISRETGDVSGGRNIWKWQSFSARRGVPLFERQICR